MVNISKKKAPTGLETYRRKLKRPTVASDYESFRNVDRTAFSELQDFLLCEQHDLCCYCQKNIIKNRMVVEHFIPKSIKGDFSLTYSNLLASCDGCTGLIRHCDKLKNSDKLEYIPNPADPDHNLDRIIDYSQKGEIKVNEVHRRNLSEKELTNFQIDINRTLNLNNETLLKVRKDKAISVINKHKDSLARGKDFKIEHFVKENTEYRGYLLWVLNQKSQK